MEPSRSNGGFCTTQWSVVLAAGRSDAAEARVALETLCGAYWYPLYAYVRRQGSSPEDAQDLTQAFFAQLLEKRYLTAADPGKGRFRSFLIASLKHFLANARDRARAQKRGGGAFSISIDLPAAEARYGGQLADVDSPERIFERQWALSLLDQVMGRLRAELTAGVNAQRFDALKPTLTAEHDSLSHAEIGRRLGMSEGAVKVAVHRLRKRYRELLREEIMRTVSEAGEIEEEMRHLLQVLAA